MQLDFHYYATYCAAFLAGYSHTESMSISYAAQFVDCCPAALLKKLGAPVSAATTQTQAELINAHSDIISLQNITRIWASFHFLPYDLYAKLPRRPRVYMNRYRLICKPNGELLRDTVNLATGSSLQAAGIAMHVLADTWAHSYFAGTPSNVINNTNAYFYELLEENGVQSEKQIHFRHNPAAGDDPEKSLYTSSLHQENENSIMNLGHGRAGHLPDYSYIRYKYLPAWKNYDIIVKDNPKEYYLAFCQMVYALKCIRNGADFELNRYDTQSTAPYEDEIKRIISTRRLNAEDDWKRFGEKLSGCSIEPFSTEKYEMQYLSSPRESRDSSEAGRFFLAAMAQKSMVTGKIFRSGNLIAGFSVDYGRSGFKGIKDYRKLISNHGGDRK